MTSTAISAQGATIMIDSSTPGTPDTLIANVFSFTGFDGESSEIDTTNLVSTAKEYLTGLQDFGSFSLEYDIDYGDAGQTELRDAQATGDKRSFILTLPNAATAAFDGQVKNASSISGGVDAKVTGSASIKVSGEVIYA